MNTKTIVLVAVAVLAVLVGGLAYVTLSGDDDERRAGALTTRSYSAGHFVLEVNGASAGFLKSVSGCGIHAETASLGPDSPKTSSVRYEPCTLQFGGGMGQPLYTWIIDALSGKNAVRNAAIVVTDLNYKAQTRLDLTSAVLTRFALPALDAASVETALFEVTLTPETIRKTAGSGATVGTLGTKTPKLLVSNFSVDGPDKSKVTKVASWAFEVPVAAEGLERSLSAGAAKLDKLTLTVNEPTTEFDPWVDQLMKGSPTQKNITLSLLDATRTQMLMEVNFSGTVLTEADLLGTKETTAETTAKRDFSMQPGGATIKFSAGING